MRIIFRFIIFIIIPGLLVQCNTPKPEKSIEDLKEALNNESIAAEKYAKFAQKASQEGFDTIARLFEAVAKSESIHAKNHEKVLEKFGLNAGIAAIGSFEINTTAENLQTAIDIETYQMNKMYIGFIRNAENEKAAEAAKSFTLAFDCENKHLNYFRLATSAIIKGNETGLPFNWYVCPNCGNTYNINNLKVSCDFCLTKQENFIGYTGNAEGE